MCDPSGRGYGGFGGSGYGGFGGGGYGGYGGYGRFRPPQQFQPFQPQQGYQPSFQPTQPSPDQVPNTPHVFQSKPMFGGEKAWTPPGSWTPPTGQPSPVQPPIQPPAPGRPPVQPPAPGQPQVPPPVPGQPQTADQMNAILAPARADYSPGAQQALLNSLRTNGQLPYGMQESDFTFTQSNGKLVPVVKGQSWQGYLNSYRDRVSRGEVNPWDAQGNYSGPVPSAMYALPTGDGFTGRRDGAWWANGRQMNLNDDLNKIGRSFLATPSFGPR